MNPCASPSNHTKPIFRVYVAGKYRGDVAANIAAARHAGRELMLASRQGQFGVLPVVPHSLARGFEEVASDDFWLAATLDLMRQCHAVYAIAGWELSVGACAEVAEAKRLGLPVAYSVSSMMQALAQECVRKTTEVWGEIAALIPAYFKGLERRFPGAKLHWPSGQHPMQAGLRARTEAQLSEIFNAVVEVGLKAHRSPGNRVVHVEFPSRLWREPDQIRAGMIAAIGGK